MEEYDIIFITNLPSFYKINLYNEINKRSRIFVIFTGESGEIRNEDFFKGTRIFDYIYLEKKNTLRKALNICQIIQKNNYNKLILGGWDSLLMWFAAYYSPIYRNAIVIESSYLESVTTGIKGFIKKRFMRRINKAYVSGKAQRILAERLNFKGEIVITKGVGLFNIVPQPKFTAKKSVKNFIYVGRLSLEKNLKYLIEIFNELPNFILNIVGFGPLENELRSLANSNIRFHGAVENKALSAYYQANDVFILPSLSETWGLVVEEAFNNNLPVIVSDKVGCADEIIVPDENGIIFSLSERDSLRDAVIKMADVDYYNKLRKNIAQMDFNKIAETQVNCYLRCLPYSK